MTTKTSEFQEELKNWEKEGKFFVGYAWHEKKISSVGYGGNIYVCSNKKEWLPSHLIMSNFYLYKFYFEFTKVIICTSLAEYNNKVVEVRRGADLDFIMLPKDNEDKELSELFIRDYSLIHKMKLTGVSRYIGD